MKDTNADNYNESYIQDNTDLFLEAMTGVSQLKNKGRELKPRLDLKAQTLALKFNSNPLQDIINSNIEFSLEYSEEFIQGYVLGLDIMIVAKLRAGQYSAEAHLDLHGLNTKQAYVTLINFFRNAYNKDYRTVLIISGKGKNSPDGQGVLKEKLQNWFTSEPFKRVILAFCTALPKHGGSGAIYVLLRKQKKNKGKIYWERIPDDPDLY